MYLVRAGAIESIDTLIRQHGQNPSSLLAHVGWTTQVLREPDTLVSYRKLADLLDHCAVVCDDPVFGFHLALIQSPLVLGELAALLSIQSTVGEGLAFSKKYHYLHASGYEFTEQHRNERMEVRYEFQFTNNTGLSQLMQLSVAQIAQYAQVFIPSQLELLRIHVTQTIPKKFISTLNWYKKLLITQSDFNGVSFPMSWLEIDLVKNTEMSKIFFQKQLLSLKSQYPHDLSSQVRHLCSVTLPSGECTIESIASLLELKPRTLQSKLKQEGTNFRLLLQTVRQNKAEQYLRDSHLSVTDIAFNIGYAESAVFVRSFKEWTGSTPLSWRKKVRTLSNS